MKFSIRLLTSVCLVSTLALSACAGVTQTKALNSLSVASSAATESLTLDLKAGQVLQLVLVRTKEGDQAKAVRQRYFQTAIAYAESLGDEFLGSLRIKNTLIGENKPSVIAMYAFPNEAAQRTFQASPDYKRMRKEGWDELHVFSTTLTSDMQLKFDPSKNYTLAAAWTQPDTLEDYQRYLNGIEADFDEIGARYLAKFTGINLQSQTDDGGDPSQLTLVEWSGEVDLKGLQQTASYKENSKYFRKAITRFDFYSITVPKQPS
jgi:uncharacterized protein (DUF1330 family)